MLDVLYVQVVTLPGRPSYCQGRLCRYRPETAYLAGNVIRRPRRHRSSEIPIGTTISVELASRLNSAELAERIDRQHQLARRGFLRRPGDKARLARDRPCRLRRAGELARCLPAQEGVVHAPAPARCGPTAFEPRRLTGGRLVGYFAMNRTTCHACLYAMRVCSEQEGAAQLRDVLSQSCSCRRMREQASERCSHRRCTATAG